MALLEADDLASFATIDPDKAEQMVADAIAQATLAAPCLADVDNLTDLQVAQAKAILRSAVWRWEEAGSGAVSQETVGPFGISVDTRQPRRGMFWPSEIAALQKICKTDRDGGAFSVDTAATPMHTYATWGYTYPWDVAPADGSGP